jgi:hypothetical protein
MCPDLFAQNLTQPDFPERGVVNIGYTGGDTTQQTIYGVNWAVQTFTTTSSFDIGGVYFKYLRTGAPGDITVSIRATVAGAPNGADLTYGTVSGNAGVTTGGAWESVSFLESYTLTSGTVYAIIFRCLTGDINNSVGLRMDTTGAYTGGQVWTSVNSGAAWAGVAGSDILFTIMGDETHNLTWLQQWEGRLIGTPFDMTVVGNIFGWDRMLAGTVIWFMVSIAIALVAVKLSNNFKAGVPVIAVVMVIGGVFGMTYAAIAVATPIIFVAGALYAVLKPAR